MIKDGTMEQRKKISAVLQDNRRSGLQRAEDVDGDELHALRWVDFLLQSRQATVSNKQSQSAKHGP